MNYILNVEYDVVDPAILKIKKEFNSNYDITQNYISYTRTTR